MLWIIGGIFVLIIIITTIYSRIYIISKYTYRQQEQLFIVSIYFHQIRLFKREYPLESKNLDVWKHLLETDNIQSSIKQAIHKVKDVHRLTSSLIKKVQFHELGWHTEVGTGEASTTGIAIGSMWMIKGTLMGIISEQCQIKCRPKIAIDPFFQNKILRSQIDCIVSIRTGQTIYVFIKLFRKVPSKKEAFI